MSRHRFSLTTAHHSTSPLIRVPLIGLLALLFMLTACTHRGDFDREAQSPSRDLAKEVFGFAASTARNEPVSFLQKTGAERRLYNTAQTIQSSPAPGNPISEVTANLKRWRVLPADNDGSTFDKADYHEALSLWDWPDSPESQYNKLRQSISADYIMFCDFLALRDEVLRLDKQRQTALDRHNVSSHVERYYASERIKENRLIIRRTMTAFHKRAAAYRYALKRLEVRAPSDQSRIVHRELDQLEVRIKRKDCHQNGIQLVTY